MLTAVLSHACHFQDTMHLFGLLSATAVSTNERHARYGSVTSNDYPQLHIDLSGLTINCVNASVPHAHKSICRVSVGYQTVHTVRCGPRRCGAQIQLWKDRRRLLSAKHSLTRATRSLYRHPSPIQCALDSGTSHSAHIVSVTTAGGS